MTEKRQFLRWIEYFRAVAIILIVIGHCYGIAGWKIQTLGDRFIANLITGGTPLFVFISGFLFHYIFYPRYEYIDFMIKKIKNVYIPYLVVAFLPICQALYLKAPYKEYFFGKSDTVFDQIIQPFFLYYLKGGVMVYWYIPFIMCIFALSPVFIWFIQQSTKTQIYLTLICYCISLLVHRPPHNLSTLQSIVYFVPIYMLGILCSLNIEWITQKVKGNDVYIFLIVMFFALLQAMITNICGNLQKDPFVFNGIDISLIQKTFLCFFFIAWLSRFEHKKIPILSNIAASSFSIYFLHGWMIYIISRFSKFYTQYGGLYLVPIISFLVIWSSYTMAKYIKIRFPSHSRLLIGW